MNGIRAICSVLRGMKKIFCAISIALLGFAAIVLPQKRLGPADASGSDPFKMETGSSFSASTSRPEKPFSDSVSSDTARRITKDVSEALVLIQKNYGGGRIKVDALAKSGIDGALDSLDPHSSYFDAAEFRELLDDQQSEYSGIGATIANYTNAGQTDTYVVAVFPGSPAARTGLGFGDKIQAVNGEKVSGMASEIVRDKVRGRDGSTVRLVIERASSGKTESFELRRSLVPQPSIPSAYILRPGIGYVDMSNGFSYSTATELSAALRDLHRQGMTGLIIDLRGNGGGILEQAVKVSETFLPYGSVIVSQRGRHQLDNRIWRSANRSPESVPVVVLVNNDSASASEVVAGALQDNDRALIVGERTFGKGLVQSVFDLPFAGGLTLTTAKYYTPSGRSIQRDYSNGDLYGYFNHPDLAAQAADPAKEARTSTNRKVFGGDGITPDETVEAPPPTRNQLSLIDPIFFFSRALVTGQAAEERRSIKIGTGRADITDQLVSRFADFGSRSYPGAASREKIAAEKSFIKLRLRYYLILSASGSAAADKVFLEDDPQIAAALNALPRARQLALAASKLKKPVSR